MGRGIALAWLFLMAFALFQHACAQNDSSLVWLAKDDAFSHAQEISGTSQNLYNATERQITDSNPSRFFFARLVSMYPEANGAVSSREDTRLLFAWGESHDPEYTITGQKQYIDCNAPWSKLSFNRSSAHFTFRFNLTNGNSSLERTVESSGSENPVPIPFTEAELDSIPSYPPGRSMPALVVSLNASITYTYLVARYHEDYECSSGPDGSKGCGCVPEYGLGNQEFTYWDNDSLEMPVENGVPAGVLVRPGGFEEPLSSAEMLVAFFSSRNVSYAMASIDNSRSQILLATYSRLDKAAFAWLAAANATDNATSQSGDFAFSQNKSEAFGYFSGIANLSAPAAYAYEYSVGAGNAGLGRHNLTISITDMFGENDTYTTVFFRKDGTTLSMKCASGSAEVSIKDSEGTPLQGAAISISPCGGASCTSDLEGRCRVACGAGIGAMSAVFNGTDKHFGSYASCSSGAGIGQDFAFGIAAACVALAFAAWLIRKKK